MPAIAPPPEPVPILARMDRRYYFAREVAEGAAEGREGRLVSGNRTAVYAAWLERSEYLHRQQDEATDELPAVFQSPVVRTVRTKFYNAGPHQPLPFPDSDD